MTASRAASIVLIGAIEAALWLVYGWNSALVLMVGGTILMAGWVYDHWRIRRNAALLAFATTLGVIAYVRLDFSIAGWIIVALVLLSSVMAAIGLSSGEYRRTRGLE